MTVQDGRARIARVSCRSRLVSSPRCWASRAAAANASTLVGVVVHPVLVDDRERHLEPFVCLVPAPAIHRQHGELGFADRHVVHGAQPRLPRTVVSANRAVARSTSPTSRWASAEATKAPCPATGSSAAPARPRESRRPTSARRRPGTCTPASSPAPSRTMPSRRGHAGRTTRHRRWHPSAAPRSSARSAPPSSRPAPPAADTARRRVAERGQPSLHRRHLAGLVGRQDELRSAAGHIGPAPWCSAGARAPAPATRGTRTSPRRAGAASITTSGSTRRSSPSRNSRNSAW